jgi:hypothetical protein
VVNRLLSFTPGCFEALKAPAALECYSRFCSDVLMTSFCRINVRTPKLSFSSSHCFSLSSSPHSRALSMGNGCGAFSCLQNEILDLLTILYNSEGCLSLELGASEKSKPHTSQVFFAYLIPHWRRQRLAKV